MENSIWSWLRNEFPLNRVVALLTPPLATLAGIIAAWLADHAPLIADQVGGGTELTAIFVAVAGTVLGMAYKWLDGWAKWEARTDVGLSLPDDVDPSEYGNLSPSESGSEDPDNPLPHRP